MTRQASLQTTQAAEPGQRVGSTGILQRKCDCGTHTPAGGACDDCRERRIGGVLQRAAIHRGGADKPVPGIVQDVLSSSGQPLDRETRSFMEPRFDHDFSRVRVHTDERAAESARAVDALAYTVGQEIVFGSGQYAPQTSAGRRLLAHELTHTIQQSRGGLSRMASPMRISEPSDASEIEADAQAARIVSSDGPTSASPGAHHQDGVLQRAGDPSQIPAGMTCTPATSTPASVAENILFPHASAALTPLQVAQIEAFVEGWNNGGANADVRVDGYASVDGPEGLNWQLSCDRAEAVVTRLQATTASGVPGIPAAFITEFAQGETSEFSAALDPNRRATISMAAPPGPAPVPPAPVPPPAAPAVPQLTPVIHSHNTGNCGTESFVIDWVLSANSSANGGFIIQDITITWNEVDCAGAAVPDPNGHVSPLRYFEAWRVLPNSTTVTPATTDTFAWASGLATGCTVDNVSFNGTARYFDNVAALPAHMIANNPATKAGILQSSLTDPALAGTASAPVRHTLTFHWNCCPCAVNATVVDGHTP